MQKLKCLILTGDPKERKKVNLVKNTKQYTKIKCRQNCINYSYKQIYNFNKKMNNEGITRQISIIKKIA